MEKEPKIKLQTVRRAVIHPAHGNMRITYDPKTVIFTGTMVPSFVKALLGNIETREERDRVLKEACHPPIKPLSEKFGVIMGQVLAHNEKVDFDSEDDIITSPSDFRNVVRFYCRTVFIIEVTLFVGLCE